MTHQPGDSFIRQRCNQCGHPVADYCAAADEYLCEPCFEFAVEMAEEKGFVCDPNYIERDSK